MKKLLIICMAGLFMASCATQTKGFNYKAHHKMNVKLQKQGYKPCSRR